MAGRKETIWQADFSLGAVRPEAVERDDTPLIERSLAEAQNTMTLATGQVQSRPGLGFVGFTDAKRGQQVDIGNGRVYDLHIVPDGVVLYKADGTPEVAVSGAPWISVANRFGTYTFNTMRFWVLPDPDTSSILIGSQNTPIQVLTRSTSGTWTFGAFLFARGLNGAILQPYWNYNPGVLIRPSARTGSITVNASTGIFTPSHVGVAIRYVDREIILDGYVSGTVMNATVTEELPPTYDITVASASGYQVGDSVEHSALGGIGIITKITGAVITVLATSGYDGFNATASPKLIAPNAAQVISVVTSVAPAATLLWDSQMHSRVYGFAGYATRHKGRAYLCDFPGAPLAFASSAVGSVSDFKGGVNDADGFTESIGSDRGGALKYMMSVEDLLFFTTTGVYYQQTRDGAVVTPKTINPISVSRLGVNEVEPVIVEDGCIFVDVVGRQVWALVLNGDVYRSWRAQHLTKFHPHLITGPVHLGATSLGSEKPEHFVYVTNADGSIAVAQWDRDEDVVSWRPWVTDGTFVCAYQAFGKTQAVVDRTIAGVPKRFRERFIFGLELDCAAALNVPSGAAGEAYFGGETSFATHLVGQVASGYMEGWDLGDFTVSGAGKRTDEFGVEIPYPDYAGVAQLGLGFDVRIVPWSRRSARTQRGIREVKRLIILFITVQSTGVFNVGVREYGGYKVGESLLAPPPLRSTQYSFVASGFKPFEAVAIVRNRPGPFRMLKLGCRVAI